MYDQKGLKKLHCIPDSRSGLKKVNCHSLSFDVTRESAVEALQNAKPHISNSEFAPRPHPKRPSSRVPSGAGRGFQKQRRARRGRASVSCETDPRGLLWLWGSGAARREKQGSSGRLRPILPRGPQSGGLKQ